MLRRTTLGIAGLTVFFVTLSVFSIWLVVHDPLMDALRDGAKGQDFPQVVQLSAAEAYGDHWTSVAVICPAEDRELVEDRLGLSLDTPEYGPAEDENIAVMLDDDGGFESVTYKRSEVDWCSGYQEAHLNPVGHLEFSRASEDAPWVLVKSY
ncbi:hypothetical protein [Corynebacterium gerontici]|uniref:Uncharacterized protein n=1 Tax=Corynebacterium gerontici TaxID=2079234 RepID=A0A3G6IZS4_9CORY|nr:hypothetical protein [Corynebacterium gerontici]AZA11197.1 hypothetical protein CGERO_04400 [Corynebacterium gerontici]